MLPSATLAFMRRQKRRTPNQSRTRIHRQDCCRDRTWMQRQRPSKALAKRYASKLRDNPTDAPTLPLRPEASFQSFLFMKRDLPIRFCFTTGSSMEFRPTLVMSVLPPPLATGFTTRREDTRGLQTRSEQAQRHQSQPKRPRSMRASTAGRATETPAISRSLCADSLTCRIAPPIRKGWYWFAYAQSQRYHGATSRGTHRRGARPLAEICMVAIVLY